MAEVFNNIVYKTKTFVTRDVAPLKRTSNERNNAMLLEAETYSHALKALSREISSWSMHADVGMSSISTLLQAAVPRVFNETLNGNAYPVGREHKLVGRDVRLEEITKARRELSERLHRDVLYPLSLWQEALRKIRIENKKVEDLRDELDERRLKRAMAAHRQESAQGTAEAAKPGTLEALAAQVQQEDDKVARLTERFTEAEAAVHMTILALIQDLHVLRDYTAAAITLMQTAFTTALSAFRLPQYVPEWTLPDGMHPRQAEELAQTRTATFSATNLPTPVAPTNSKETFSKPVSAAAQSALARELSQVRSTRPLAAAVSAAAQDAGGRAITDVNGQAHPPPPSALTSAVGQGALPVAPVGGSSSWRQ